MQYANAEHAETRGAWREAQGLSHAITLHLSQGEELEIASGGLVAPYRSPLGPGLQIYRLVASREMEKDLEAGKWWIDRAALDKLLSFATDHGISVGLAARVLCLVLPPFNDMAALARMRVRQPLWALRGLGQSLRPRPGQPALSAHNHIAGRRVEQIFIPGLRGGAGEGVGKRALQLEEVYRLDKRSSVQGWLYL